MPSLFTRIDLGPRSARRLGWACACACGYNLLCSNELVLICPSSGRKPREIMANRTTDSEDSFSSGRKRELRLSRILAHGSVSGLPRQRPTSWTQLIDPIERSRRTRRALHRNSANSSARNSGSNRGRTIPRRSREKPTGFSATAGSGHPQPEESDRRSDEGGREPSQPRQ